jgi:hypothetical protein
MFTEIKVGVAYKLDGEVIPHFPGTLFLGGLCLEFYKMDVLGQFDKALVRNLRHCHSLDLLLALLLTVHVRPLVSVWFITIIHLGAGHIKKKNHSSAAAESSLPCFDDNFHTQGRCCGKCL